MPVRVLLAEDNESLSRMLQSFLAALELEVFPAATGTEALRILAANDIDLLLLDLRLPELSGVEVLQRVRKSSAWSSLPVIVMTGVYKDERHIDAARRLGIKHYLQKPFTRDAFLQAIQSSLTEIRQKDGVILLHLLVHVYTQKKSGLLTINGCSPIVCIKGEPYSFLARGRDDFPAFLVSKGKIDPSDAKLFVESGEERIFLTQAGFLPWDELADESRQYLGKCIIDSLELKGVASFKEGLFPPEFPLVPLSVPALIYEATKGHASRFDADCFLRDYSSRHPARTPLFYRYANLIAMRQEDIDILGAIDGKKSVEEIMTSTGAKTGVVAFIQYLFVLGMLEMHPQPTQEALPDFQQKNLLNRPIEEAKSEEVAVGFDDLVEELSNSVELAVGVEGMAAPLSADEIGFEQTVQRDYAFVKDKNYYEVFGLTPGTFSFDALKEAYFAKSRLYSPERFMELPGAMQGMAQEILSLYAHAYNTLSSVVAKERYDEMLNANKVGLAGKQDDKLQARIQFQSGMVFLEMGEYDNAEKALQDAYTLEPENPLHCAYLAWAIYKNPANRNSRASQEKARNLLSKSLQNERNAEAYAFRGWILLDEGRDGLAEGEFQKALKLNGNEANARKGLGVITEKREAQNKGFLRKFFG